MKQARTSTKVETSRKRTSHHNLVAPVAGLAVTALIIVLFNSQYLYARAMLWLHPADAQTMSILNQDSDMPVSQQSRIIIPKLNVDAPIVYGIGSDEPSIQHGLESGVVHLAGTVKPGMQGNSVFVGHSSNDVWKPGDYKFVFALLERLDVGDEYVIETEGIKYIYRVDQKLIVEPSDVSVLKNDGTKATSTLITCTPTGTSVKRLVIHSVQISPTIVQRATLQAGPSTPPTVLPGN